MRQLLTIYLIYLIFSLILSITASDFVNVQHNPQYFRWLTNRFHVCDIPEFNQVIPRDTFGRENFPLYRNWTVLSNSMLEYVGVQGSKSNNLPICQGTDEITTSVSLFPHAHTYTVPWLNMEDICTVLSYFDSVRLVGDSRMRHHTQGLYMIIKENLRYGAICNEEYQSCACDGQFSETYTCRYGVGAIAESKEAGHYAYCSASIHDNFPTIQYLDGEKMNMHPPDFGYLCANTTLMRFIGLTGGPHAYYNSETYIYRLIIPYLKAIFSHINACCYPIRRYVRIAWFAADPHATILESKYPAQSLDRVIRFNEEISLFLAQNYSGIVFVDLFNMTRDALEGIRTSDGTHFLTDINIIKAMLTLNLMNSMSDARYVPYIAEQDMGPPLIHLNFSDSTLNESVLGRANMTIRPLKSWKHAIIDGTQGMLTQYSTISDNNNHEMSFLLNGISSGQYYKLTAKYMRWSYNAGVCEVNVCDTGFLTVLDALWPDFNANNPPGNEEITLEVDGTNIAQQCKGKEQIWLNFDHYRVVENRDRDKRDARGVSQRFLVQSVDFRAVQQIW